MTMYNEACENKSLSVGPGPTPLSAMLGEARDLTKKAFAIAITINANCFGKQAKDMKPDESRCLRDAVAQHVDDLKALCEELNEILMGLEV